MQTVIRYFFALFLIFSIYLSSLPTAFACGPFSLDPVFSYSKHLSYPIEKNFQDEIGIVPESFGRSSLYVFYRRLNNLPLSEYEKSQVAEAIYRRIGNGKYSVSDNQGFKKEYKEVGKDDGYSRWENARTKVNGEKPKIETQKEYEDYSYYENCLEDSFSTAAATLEKRIAQYGTNEDVRNWLKGQDSVFSNCGENGVLPETTSDSFPEWLKKDRDYQIAAALFYQNDFPAARAKFEKISADKNSVWQKTAKFVVARTYIRQASLIDESVDDRVETPTAAGSSNSMVNTNTNYNSSSSQKTNKSSQVLKTAAEKKKDKEEFYQKAVNQLREVLADDGAKEFHASAERLINLIFYRTNPEQQRKNFALRLAQKSENKSIFNNLRDYIFILDKIDNEVSEKGLEIDRKEAEAKGVEYDYNYRIKLRDVAKDVLTEDLTDWLITYQSADSFEHAFANWQKSKNLAWFTAAISKVSGNSPKSNELLNEAAKIPFDSPAYATVFYHQIRLLIEQNRTDEARQKLDKLMARDFSRLNRSSQNMFLAQRMLLAQNLDEFLKFAQRKAAAFVWSDDANEEGAQNGDDEGAGQNQIGKWKDRTMFDADAVNLVNQKMPLSVMREAALSPQLPDHLKKFFLIAVWTRAFILGNRKIETEFAPLLLQYAPEFSASVNEYLKADTPVDRRAAQFLVVLRNPLIDAQIPVGQGRGSTEPNSIDSIRGNWWCIDEFPKDVKDISFLTEAQKQEAANERKLLISNGQAATFLAREAVAFANKNPAHPSVPEILHLAVRSTRYGCTDVQTLRFSKAAFDILHKQFPKNPWTAKTPYYFGNK